MHFSLALVSLLTASTALATPLLRRQENETSIQTQQYGGDERVTVILRNEYKGIRSKTSFDNVDSRRRNRRR